MSTHILLVSAQSAPNLIATLDPSIKPAQAILAVSQEMQPKAQALQTVLTEAGVRVQTLDLRDAHSPASVEEDLMQLATQLEDEEVFLNVTGGTKLMALCAQAVAVAANWKVFYVDADTDQLVWLDPDSRAQPAQQLTEQLRLNHYLRSYGFTPNVLQAFAPERAMELCEDLVLNIGSLEIGLGQMNYLCSVAERRNPLQVKLDGQQLDSRSLQALVDKCTGYGLVTLKGDMLTFANKECLQFVHGGWLEHYIYQKVCSLSGPLNIRDKAMNLEVTNPQGVKNELDVIFLAKNRPYVIECKTARMNQGDKANDALFKLADKQRIVGIGLHAMLASYRPLRDEEKKLADALRIKVVAGRELPRFEELLRTWVAEKAKATREAKIAAL